MSAVLLVATGFGAGRVPIAPGTAGSAQGVLLFWLLARYGGPWAPLVGFVVVAALGFWSAGAAARQLGGEDPGPVVIDEIAGQMLALLFLPPSWVVLLAGFLLFRIADILKPFPARRLETLHGAAGIMADDLAVALYVNLLLQVLRWGFPEWLA